MRRIVLGILALLLISTTWAQSSSRFKYGFGTNLTIPSVQRHGPNLSTLPGYGFFMRFNYAAMNGSYSLSNKYQFNRYFYYSKDITSNISVANYELYLGLEGSLSDLPGLMFFMHMVPSYSQVKLGYLGLVGGSKAGTVSYDQIIPDLDNKLNAGVEIGIGTEIVDGLRLDFSYLWESRNEMLQDYIDAKPSALKLGLSFTIGAKLFENKQLDTVAMLMDQLANDTLYVVNRACSEYMTDSLLYELFSIHYKYSAFRIVQDHEIDELSSGRALFFALVGQYYAGPGEPLSDGIYFMDGSFNLTSYPYPVHTNYQNPGFESADDCFGDRLATAKTISKFSSRLQNTSSY